MWATLIVDVSYIVWLRSTRTVPGGTEHTKDSLKVSIYVAQSCVLFGSDRKFEFSSRQTLSPYFYRCTSQDVYIISNKNLNKNSRARNVSKEEATLVVLTYVKKPPSLISISAPLYMMPCVLLKTWYSILFIDVLPPCHFYCYLQSCWRRLLLL